VQVAVAGDVEVAVAAQQRGEDAVAVRRAPRPGFGSAPLTRTPIGRNLAHVIGSHAQGGPMGVVQS
jgi:hypothetical protein